MHGDSLPPRREQLAGPWAMPRVLAPRGTTREAKQAQSLPPLSPHPSFLGPCPTATLGEGETRWPFGGQMQFAPCWLVSSPGGWAHHQPQGLGWAAGHPPRPRGAGSGPDPPLDSSKGTDVAHRPGTPGRKGGQHWSFDVVGAVLLGAGGRGRRLWERRGLGGCDLTGRGQGRSSGHLRGIESTGAEAGSGRGEGLSGKQFSRPGSLEGPSGASAGGTLAVPVLRGGPVLPASWDVDAWPSPACGSNPGRPGRGRWLR